MIAIEQLLVLLEILVISRNGTGDEILYVTYLYEAVETQPQTHTNKLKSDFNWKKWVLPAAAIVGTGLLGYGGYKIFNHGQEVENQQYDVDNLQRIVDNRKGEEQTLENMRRMNVPQDDIAVQQNKINVIKNQENIMKRNFIDIHGKKTYPEVRTDSDFQTYLN